MVREEGFYWVKLLDEWVVAHWHSVIGRRWRWRLSLIDEAFYDTDFDEIDERRLTRG